MAESILSEIEGRRQSDVPQRMRRCFMTGKQCIFRSQGGDGAVRQEPRGMFIVMPFSPNLNTFYEWSLKPYLRSQGIAHSEIQRADQFSKIGYVMCEHICRRIQDAAVVAVDLSLNNANCFYELGLAIGLGKPILALCDQTLFAKVEHYWSCIGIDETRVLQYPGVGYLDASSLDLRKYVHPVAVNPRQPEMRIVPLVIRDPEDMQDDRDPEDMQQRRDPKDIPLTFSDAIESAVGVAIDRVADKTRSGAGPLADAVRVLGEERVPEDGGKQLWQEILEGLKKTRPVYLPGQSADGSARSVAEKVESAFPSIADKVDSAFACIVDLVDEHPLSYFWLGYCHARGINVIPIDRQSKAKRKKPPERDDHVLAFDIRALWYMRHSEERPEDLANGLGAVLEELIIKDVPTQQRRIFWERITRRGEVHIYTGAVHHGDLRREVVGDWDLRTVSELVRHLSSTEESVVPKLERPFYAPEKVDARLAGASPDRELLGQYIALVSGELNGKNCLIVASADVNPITEVVLACAYRGKAYGAPWEDYCFAKWTSRMNPTGTVVALKGTQNPADDGADRCFSLPGHGDLPADHRGFLLDGNRVIHKPYLPQGHEDPRFSVLGHLMVLRNPFSADPDDIIVVLNGVSGPGTYGMAEALTGGTEKAIESEQVLKKINEEWERGERTPGDFRGIEAFIEVLVRPQEADAAQDTGPAETEAEAPAASRPKPAAAMKLSDERVVAHWDRCPPKNIGIDNPRLLRS